eukprot:CAMPEP_0198199414 /NCGR_PEP_ID=MMETSP1445-20131203/2720_1 /TAXON_ID=36898 /ORGANISM="Pyramimonas sp., Strain CCMP2087" /LENGTH=306 /DNA_ID=CAMNT_0043869253 /DNA_START=258 /DNA_END=1175 /DNA_ORIENTATION=+
MGSFDKKGSFDQPRKKFKKKTIAGLKPIKKAVNDTSVAGVKRQIRSLERLLKREGLPAELIKAKQEELEGLQGKKAKCFEHKRAEKFDLKYKHIRFFEQRKVDRKIHQLEKKKAGSGVSLSAEEAAALLALREDREYIVHFPKSEKYIALFAEVAEEWREDTERRRALMRQRIKVELSAQQAEDADLALLTDLNEGSVAKPKKVLPAADKPAKQKSKVLDHKPSVLDTALAKLTSKRKQAETDPEDVSDVSGDDYGDEDLEEFDNFDEDDDEDEDEDERGEVGADGIESDEAGSAGSEQDASEDEE